MRKRLKSDSSGEWALEVMFVPKIASCYLAINFEIVEVEVFWSITTWLRMWFPAVN